MSGKMILLVGLPASGKSTWVFAQMIGTSVDRISRCRVNWDELRVQMGFTTFKREQEEAMKRESERLVSEAVKMGIQEIIIEFEPEDKGPLEDSGRGTRHRLRGEMVYE